MSSIVVCIVLRIACDGPTFIVCFIFWTGILGIFLLISSSFFFFVTLVLLRFGLQLYQVL